jgi:DHA1 family multidrug resistance protein-like MFS transporter
MKFNRNLAILFFTMVVVMLGFGIMIPIMPFYVESFGASGTELGLLMAIFSIMQFIFSPIWGKLSDQIGRKKVLMLGILGNALTTLFFALSTSLTMLFVARALSGILSSATMPTMMAYISDSTDRKSRGGGMGVIGAAMGVGMVLGPGIGGWFGEDNLATPFFVATGLSMIALLLVALILPESLPLEQRAPRGQRVFSGPEFGLLWRSLFGPLGFLFFLSFLVNFALTNFEGIFGLWAAHRFDYGPSQVGTIMTVIGVVSAVVQGMLTGPTTRRWGEAAVIKASLFASAIGFVLMLLAVDFASVLITVGFFVTANAMLRPAINALVSYKAGNQQGMAMGLTNSYMSLGRVIGPIWAGSLFDLNISLPYLSAAALMVISYGLSLWMMRQPAGHLAEMEEQAISFD